MTSGTAPSVFLTHTVTSTPLARLHARDVNAKTGVRYASFDRSCYPKAALELAGEAQRALAVGEYLAVDLFSKLAAALTLAGVPLDIVSAAARVPADEARHTELALRMAGALSDRVEPLRIPIDRHQYLAGPISMKELDIAMLEMPTLGETLACALLSASKDIADDPVVEAHFAALLRDEVHHARLGWHYLAWRSEQWTTKERQAVADCAGNFVVHTEKMFSRGRDAPKGAGRAARALGVLDTKTQRRAIRVIMEEELLPGLDGLGLGASHAWRARRALLG